MNLPNLEKVLKSTPLEDRIGIMYMMKDEHNWVNGSYLGDLDFIAGEVKEIIDTVNKWMLDGMPGQPSCLSERIAAEKAWDQCFEMMKSPGLNTASIQSIQRWKTEYINKQYPVK